MQQKELAPTISEKAGRNRFFAEEFVEEKFVINVRSRNFTSALWFETARLLFCTRFHVDELYS